MSRNNDPRRRILAGTPAVLAWLLVTAVVGQAQPGGQVAEFIERTGEIIDQAAELVLETEHQQARRILEEARNLHQRARHMLEHGRPVQALAASRRAREAALHAARLARETHNQQDRFRLRLERFQEQHEQLRERAREADDERALRFLHEAAQQGLRAAGQDRQGNHDLAWHLLRAAEEMLARAGRLLDEGFGGERLQRELERTRILLDRTAEQLQHLDGPQRETGADLLRSATEALSRAEDFQARRQPLQAMHSLRLARQLAGQAAALGQEPVRSEDIAEQLARWDERHERIADQVRESGAEPALAALQRARHHRAQAGGHLDAGHLEAALRQLRAAFDLLNEANELSR